MSGRPITDDASWHRSSLCSSAGCVEAKLAGDLVLVRASKLGGDSPIQEWTVKEWVDLLRVIKDPEGSSSAWRWLPDFTLIQLMRGRVALTFTNEEWDDFTGGVQLGDFEPRNLVPAAPSGVDVRADEAAWAETPAAAAAGTGDDPPIAPVPVAPHEDSPAGQGSSVPPLVTDGPLRAGQPGPDERVVEALLELSRPDWAPGLKPTFASVEGYAREWAHGAFVAGAAFAEGLAHRKLVGLADAATEMWARLTAPLNDFEDSPATVPVGAVTVSERSAAVTGAGREVAPEEGSGATEPMPEWEREFLDREWREREARGGAS